MKKNFSMITFFAGIMTAMLTVTAVFTITLLVNKNMGGSKNPMYTQPKYIAPYLYEMYYNNYTEDTDGTTAEFDEAFGCSSVRNGNFYGRNFDYIFNDVPEFVVHMAKTDTRHASIGVAAHNGLRDTMLLQGKYDKQLELVPNLTLDGINDAGVIASINVVPGAEDVGELTGTNPNGKDLSVVFSVRYILDNADSADHAVELLKARNLVGRANNGMYLHIMIADPKKTYVVELINNQLVAEEKTGDEQIMTNFYVNLPELTENASGVERYAILKENYKQGSSLSGMRELMMRVKFSNAYSYTTNPSWFSEALPQSVIKNPSLLYSEEYMGAFDDTRKDYWNYITNDLRNPANPSFWHTTHNSVYDIENKVLRLTVQEDYSNYYDFKM